MVNMVYALYRSNSVFESLSTQEKSVNAYLKRFGLSVDRVFTDFSPTSKELDERLEFKEFLQGNIKEGDVVVVYDLWSFSHKADELVKIFTCLFKKNTVVHITKKEVELRSETSSFLLLGLINEIRDRDLEHKISITSGRPKGSISKSRFDELRGNIIEMLRDGVNVSEISRVLNVNRSSLKDYICSRELKEIAQSASKIQAVKESSIILEQSVESIKNSIECPFERDDIKKGEGK